MSNNEQTTQIATIMPNIFGDIDFSTLNKTITALGNGSGDLSDKEKELAVEAVNTWQESVINRLKDKEDEANCYIDFLNVNYNRFAPWQMDQYSVEMLIEAAGLQDMYQEYLDKMDEYTNLPQPERPVIDTSTTLMEQMKARTDYDLEYQVWLTKRQKIEREAYNIMRKLKIELNKLPEIQELLLRMKKYKRNVSKFKNQCIEKSQLAKINVSISSEEVRNSLRDLLNFSINI